MKKNINKKNGWSENKIRIGITISPEAIDIADKVVDANGCRSRSDFIEKAMKFYAGYISTKDHSGFIAEAVAIALRGYIKTTEERLARMGFKLSVEMAKIVHMIAPLCEINDSELYRLHRNCVEELKNTDGIVKLESVLKGEL